MSCECSLGPEERKINLIEEFLPPHFPLHQYQLLPYSDIPAHTVYSVVGAKSYGIESQFLGL